MTRSKRYISENMLFDGMSIEENRKLKAEAKENLKTNQKQAMPTAPGSEGRTSKEVARKIWKKSITGWKVSFGALWKASRKMT